jgi:hypothetical protein
MSVHWQTHLTVTLTVTGANPGEHREMWDLRIWLKQAVYVTAANSGESNETNAGSVSPGTNPGPAAPPKPHFKGIFYFPLSSQPP